MTRTSQLDFGSGPDADPAYQWDTKHKLFSLAEVGGLPSAVLFPKVKVWTNQPFSSLADRQTYCLKKQINIHIVF